MIPQTSGSNVTAAHSKIIVRTKDMTADVTPSFSAVKNPDEKMPKPIKTKDNVKMRKPEIVNRWPYETKQFSVCEMVR